MPTDEPQGAKIPTLTMEQAEKRAIEVLGKLLMPDTAATKVSPHSFTEGGWSVEFTQRMHGINMLMDKPLQVDLTEEGQVTYIVGRRRPILAQSAYPLRSPQEAWELVERGFGFSLGIVRGKPKAETGPFIVIQVELAYVLTHATKPLEIIQPYYVFQDEHHRTLFVPAVADPYAQWPNNHKR